MSETNSFDSTVDKIRGLPESLKLTSKSELFITYLSYLLFGIVGLFPFSAIITQTQYFSTIVPESLTNIFSSTLCICSMTGQIIGCLINIGYAGKFRSKLKIIAIMIFIFFGFLFITLIVSFCESKILLAITIYTLTFPMNILTPILMSSMYEELRYYDKMSFNMFNGGAGASGLITALLSLSLYPANLTPKNSFLIYFILSLSMIIIFLLLYIKLIKSNHYIYSYKINGMSCEKEDNSSLKEKFKSMYRVGREVWTSALSMILTMGLTLYIFPVLSLSIESVSTYESWKNYYPIVTIFLSFGAGDTLGRYINHFCSWPKPRSKWILILSLSRFSFIILFLVCNRPGKKTQKISFLEHDIFPALLNFFLGITNAHLITILMGTPYLFENDKDKIDGTKTFVLCLYTGLALGAFMSFMVPYF